MDDNDDHKRSNIHEQTGTFQCLLFATLSAYRTHSRYSSPGAREARGTGNDTEGECMGISTANLVLVFVRFAWQDDISIESRLTLCCRFIRGGFRAIN